MKHIIIQYIKNLNEFFHPKYVFSEIFALKYYLYGFGMNFKNSFPNMVIMKLNMKIIIN